jgi:hypothetical protein
MALTQVSTDGIKNGTITGSDLATSVDLVDNQKIRFGTSNDLQIYHDGSNSIIEDTGTGALVQKLSGLKVRSTSDELMILALQNNQVELYYNGSKKFETKSDGVDITGELQCDSLDVDGGVEFTPGSGNFVNFFGASNHAKWDFNNSRFLWDDNAKAVFGDSADLQIFHDGNNSYVSAVAGTGDLFIKSADDIYLRANGDNGGIDIHGQGAVDLYHNGSKKFETTSSGGIVTGTLHVDGLSMGDNEVIKIGDGNDLRLFHNGSHSYIADVGTGDLRITGTAIHLQNAAQSENMLRSFENGAVELFYDNSKKFETTSYGALVTGTLSAGSGNFDVTDNGKFKAGNSSDLQIFHDGSSSRIYNSTGDLVFRSASYNLNSADGSEPIIVGAQNGSVELYYDNSKKFETASYGAVVTGTFQATGNIEVFDNGKLNVGTSADLQIYHDGTNSLIQNSTGYLELNANAAAWLKTTQFNVIDNDATHYHIRTFKDNQVELYHNNSKKLETTSAGVQITGALNVTTTMHIPDGSIGLQIGSSNDLKIYHNGSGSYISEQGTGELILKSNSISFTNAAENEHLARFFQDSGVELYNNGTKKFATGGSGVYHDNNGTLSQNGIHFERGQNTGDYSTIFGVTNYPDASGYSDQNDGYWGKIESKGGCVIILNTDGGRNDGRNTHDHFSIYHKANNSSSGKRAFSVDHTGGIQCGKAGINIDREWENQPSFSMTRDCNDGTNNTDNNAYFRFHGTGRTHAQWTGGSSGNDFSANMLLDGGNYNASDRRAKTDIVDCPYGLDVVNKLKPRKYQLVNSQLEPQGDDNINLGFIAQEIMEHIPECVNYLGDKANTPNEKGFARAYALDTNEIVAVLTKAIQELAAKVAVLESKT